MDVFVVTERRRECEHVLRSHRQSRREVTRVENIQILSWIDDWYLWARVHRMLKSQGKERQVENIHLPPTQ